MPFIAQRPWLSVMARCAMQRTTSSPRRWARSSTFIGGLGARSAVALLSLLALAGDAIAACKLAKMAELPVTMAGLRPVIKAQINGSDANFIVDSGAFYSMLSPAGAAEYKLRLAPVPINLIVSGVGGGAAHVSLTTVKVF